MEKNWQDYRPLVKAMARRYQGRGMELADLEQEGWLALWEASQCYQPQLGTPKEAFYRLRIRSALKKMLRRYCRDALSLTSSEDICSLNLEQSQGDEELDLLAFETLPQRQAQVLRAWCQGLSLTEAASILGLSPSTAQTYFKRALKRFALGRRK